jgi:hypothetical protein
MHGLHALRSWSPSHWQNCRGAPLVEIACFSLGLQTLVSSATAYNLGEPRPDSESESRRARADGHEAPSALNANSIIT